MRIHIFLLVAVCLLIQCDSVDDGMRLTKPETDRLVYGFMETVLYPDLEEKEVHTESESRDDVTYLCPEGGTVRIDATTLESSSGLRVTAETSGTFIPQVCMSSGFVLTGNPSIVFSLIYNVTPTTEGLNFDMGGKFNGTLDWDYDDRSGTCRWALDLDLEGIVTSDLDSAEIYLRGQACDNDVDINISDIFEIDI